VNVSLPTAKELEKLPLRAVVAYAARTARRLSSELRDVVADDILEEALRLVDTVTVADPIIQVDPASVVRASENVTSAYEAAPGDMKSVVKLRMVFSLAHAALAAMYAVLAAEDRSHARHNMKRAAEDAQRAIRPVNALTSNAASLAAQAARRDYDVLLQEYGEHEEVIIGEPVHCFDAK
jgi:hypothetical protein